jgi:hypothetical protein
LLQRRKRKIGLEAHSVAFASTLANPKSDTIAGHVTITKSVPGADSGLRSSSLAKS